MVKTGMIHMAAVCERSAAASSGGTSGLRSRCRRIPVCFLLMLMLVVLVPGQ